MDPQHAYFSYVCVTASVSWEMEWVGGMVGDDEAYAFLTACILLENEPAMYGWHIKGY